MRKPIDLNRASIVQMPGNDDWTFEHRSLIQTMLLQNMSIDHIAELLAGELDNHSLITLWRNRILRAVSLGKLKA